MSSAKLNLESVIFDMKIRLPTKMEYRSESIEATITNRDKKKNKNEKEE